MQKMWKAITEIPIGYLKPGDSFVWVGGEEEYGPGTYECVSCRKQFVLKETKTLLPVCRTCKKGTFRFTAAACLTFPRHED